MCCKTDIVARIQLSTLHIRHHTTCAVRSCFHIRVALASSVESTFLFRNTRIIGNFTGIKLKPLSKITHLCYVMLWSGIFVSIVYKSIHEWGHCLTLGSIIFTCNLQYNVLYLDQILFNTTSHNLYFTDHLFIHKILIMASYFYTMYLYNPSLCELLVNEASYDYEIHVKCLFV